MGVPVLSPEPETRAQSTLRISRELERRLRCPACIGPLDITDQELICPACRNCYPVRNGVAALIDEPASVTTMSEALTPVRALSRIRRFCLPELSRNSVADANLSRFCSRLLSASPWPVVLVIGGGRLGVGMAPAIRERRIEFVETDIRLIDRTHLLCDAHRLPFEAASFDGVIIQAVLEHVADPATCVQEIHRVLKPGGLVYAETAFMQQVHAGPFDFTRFTHVGHRRLFRNFQEIESGAAAGPAVALAWSWQHFLLSFAAGRAGRIAATVAGALTAFWLKYLDPYLLRSPAALDAASAFYFLGERQPLTLTDRETIRTYRGAQRASL